MHGAVEGGALLCCCCCVLGMAEAELLGPRAMQQRGDVYHGTDHSVLRLPAVD